MSVSVRVHKLDLFVTSTHRCIAACTHMPTLTCCRRAHSKTGILHLTNLVLYRCTSCLCTYSRFDEPFCLLLGLLKVLSRMRFVPAPKKCYPVFFSSHFCKRTTSAKFARPKENSFLCFFFFSFSVKENTKIKKTEDMRLYSQILKLGCAAVSTVVSLSCSAVNNIQKWDWNMKTGSSCFRCGFGYGPDIVIL